MEANAICQVDGLQQQQQQQQYALHSSQSTGITAVFTCHRPSPVPPPPQTLTSSTLDIVLKYRLRHDPLFSRRATVQLPPDNKQQTRVHMILATAIVLLFSLFLRPAMSFVDFVARSFGLNGALAPPGPASSSSSPSNNNSSSKTPTARSGSASNGAASPGHQPSPMDAHIAKMMLVQGMKLPSEVVLAILDFAEYWPHQTASLGRSIIVSSGRNTENVFLLRTKPLGMIKSTHYNADYYAHTPAPPIPFDPHAEYPLAQFQDWIGGPTKTIQHPCRKIVFTFTSRDQGWGGSANDRGTYRGSYTWFEAGLERLNRNAARPKNDPERLAGVDDDDAPPADAAQLAEAPGDSSSSSSSTQPPPPPPPQPLPDPYLPVYALRPIYPTVNVADDNNTLHHSLLSDAQHTIQHNKTATRTPTTHRVVWSWDDGVRTTSQQLVDCGRGAATGTGDFVRALKLGDVVTVWAKARFPGWANHVESAKVDVYWAL